MAGRLAAPRAGRRAALLALVVAVVLVHGCVASAVAERMADFNAAQSMPPRMEVAYVRELAPAEPPAAVAAPVAPPMPPAVAPRAPTVAPVARAASAVPAEAPVEEAPPPEDTLVASAPASEQLLGPADVAGLPPEPAASAEAPPLPADGAAAIASAVASASAASASASAAAEPAPVIAAAASAASSPTAAAVDAADAAALAGFDWPASTRLSFRLTGYFRGEVAGTAQVEWIRKGARYQVHLDTTIGPSIAPLFTRRMSSQGDITPAGLAPRRFDQLTKSILRNAQQQTLLIDGDSVILNNGERRERPPGVQDLTSQFVQLSYLFGLQPERLRAGARIDMPLAMPRKVERWVYDVKGEETLSTPIGELATFHLVPRREAGPVPGDLIMETWYAPSLRYLPVRIRIQQDADNFVDLLLSRRPEVAAP